MEDSSASNLSPQQLQEEALIRQDEYGKPRICLRPTVVPNLDQIIHVACPTIFINGKGRGYATGFGVSGQLGLGSEGDQFVSQGLRGKALDKRILVWADAGAQYSVVAATTR
ncbi:hypothetical protein ACHAQJ_006544 [Trichoderma viride]